MNEATITCGEDPDFAKRDLYETIEKGGNVSWTMKVQVSFGTHASGGYQTLRGNARLIDRFLYRP
jgi:catalase